MFRFFKKRREESVIKLVYPADTTLCPDCGSYKKGKTCSRCKKMKKEKKIYG